MARRLVYGLVAAAIAALGAGTATAAGASQRTLRPFASEAELASLLDKWRSEAQARRNEIRQRLGSGVVQSLAAAPAAPAAEAARSADSVTNVQHAGVDEGGIVKTHGDHLVILRRGRLFTVAIGDRALAPVSIADAFGPDIDPRGAWYDEMLVADGRVVVIGYSYARGGTEIGVFAIDGAGRLEYKSTWHLRSNDYYSSRNYASRLIGAKLILYSPLMLNPYAPDSLAAFPAIRRWQKDAAGGGEFRRIAPATRIYRTDEPLDPSAPIALHTVTTCDLARDDLACESTAVMGGAGRVFYVSPQAVYVWSTTWTRRAQQSTAVSSLFRLPLDAGAPTGIKVSGSPIDQFSFHEGADAHLNVLVRADGRGDGMWSAEARAGDLALLRLPRASFGDGRAGAPAGAYRTLPRVDGWSLQSRYVGPWLVYGVGTGWRRPGAPADGKLYALRYAEAGAAQKLALGHAVDRIEALGANAVAIGSDGRNLHFTALALGRSAQTAGRYVRADAAQGETRSHGFFYRASDDSSGMIGLPIIVGGESAAGQLRRAPAGVVFVRNQGLVFTEAGTLDASAVAADDGCRASCVDWYGNARPLFLRGRVFALMGYEIVEGRVEAGGRIAESRRISFAPREAALVSR